MQQVDQHCKALEVRAVRFFICHKKNEPLPSRVSENNTNNIGDSLRLPL